MSPVVAGADFLRPKPITISTSSLAEIFGEQRLATIGIKTLVYRFRNKMPETQ